MNRDVLVVVGYSFSLFNRKVDKDLLSKISKLKKVYFEAPDAEDLRERFLAIRNDVKKNLLVRSDLK